MAAQQRGAGARRGDGLAGTDVAAGSAQDNSVGTRLDCRNRGVQQDVGIHAREIARDDCLDRHDSVTGPKGASADLAREQRKVPPRRLRPSVAW